MKARQRMEERSAIYNLKMLIVLGFISIYRLDTMN